jgi:hypothetical protein
MVKELRIYYEGDEGLKPGFDRFLTEIKEAARNKQCEFVAVATNGTPAKDYVSALRAHRTAWNVLLLDSDETLGRSSANLLRRKGLQGCDPDSVFWMVEIMESWFFADIEALERHYKGGFKTKAVRGNPEVEKIPKADVLSKLENATRGTKGGKYRKNHAFKLLELIDPAKVREAAPNCDRMFRLILARLG